jgi:hypothetical protein
MKITNNIMEKKVVVSEDFVNIYKNFNVINQVENMKTLTERELYLLLTVCLDKHDDELPVVKYNFQPFKDQVMEIFDIQDDKETTNKILQCLIDETGSQYIETSDIVNSKDEKLPEPYTKEEIRDVKISLIGDGSSK